MARTLLSISLILLLISCTKEADKSATPTHPEAPDVPAPPQVLVVSVAPQDELGELEGVSIRFDQSMDPDSLNLAGSLLNAAYSLSWANTTHPNDTLQLLPAPAWQPGTGELTVSAQSVEGGAMASPLVLTYTVKEQRTLSFVQRPASIIGDTSATFEVACDPADCTLDCTFNGDSVSPCLGPLAFDALEEGQHRFQATATWSMPTQTKSISRLFRVKLSPPEVVSAAWVGYGVAEIQFDETLSAADVHDLGRYQISPTRPTGLDVTGASVVGGNRLRLEVFPYHLPIDYEFTVTVEDTVGNILEDANVAIAGAGNGSRVAFVSSAAGTADITSWDILPGSSTFDRGAHAADTVCQILAESQDFKGEFRAYLTDATDHAACRIGGGAGAMQDLCGFADGATPEGGPWILPNGLPVYRSVEDLFYSNPLRPLAYDESGETELASVDIWFSTSAQLQNVCDNWTDEEAGNGRWTPAGRDRLPCSGCTGWRSCDLESRVFCMQTGAGGHMLDDRWRHEGKLVFVTEQRTPGRVEHGELLGLAAADAICQEEAVAAGLAAERQFVAWISDSTHDAYCRVLGKTGQVANDCGEESLPNGGGPWVTAVGWPFTQDVQAITLGEINVPPGHTLLDRIAETSSIWTGTNSAGTLHDASCDNWQSVLDTDDGRTGLTSHRTQWRGGPNIGKCHISRPLLCFEL